MNFVMDHIVLNCMDVEKEVDFYCSVFGFFPERLEMYRENRAPFPSVRINADTIIDLFPRDMCGGGQERERGTTNLNHFCLAVRREDFTKLVERLDELEILIEQGPVERWGAHGTGISVYFRDPEQNLIEIRYYPNGDGPAICLLGT